MLFFVGSFRGVKRFPGVKGWRYFYQPVFPGLRVPPAPAVHCWQLAFCKSVCCILMDRHQGLLGRIQLAPLCFLIWVSVVKLSEGCYDLCSLELQGRRNPQSPSLLCNMTWSLKIQYLCFFFFPLFQWFFLMLMSVLWYSDFHSWEEPDHIFKNRPSKMKLLYDFILSGNFCKKKKKKLGFFQKKGKNC